MQPTESEFERPPIAVGDVVLWSRDGNEGEVRSPSLVLRVGNRTVQLKTFTVAHPHALVKESVHHIDDPLRKKGNRGDDGCWEYGPSHKLAQAICDDVEAILGKHSRLDVKVHRLSREIAAIRKAMKTGKEVEPVEEEDASQADEPATTEQVN